MLSIVQQHQSDNNNKDSLHICDSKERRKWIEYKKFYMRNKQAIKIRIQPVKKKVREFSNACTGISEVEILQKLRILSFHLSPYLQFSSQILQF